MVVAELGDEPFPYPLHEKLLRYLAECAETGCSPREEIIEEKLGAEAEEEISHALIEEATEKKDSYEACLRVLLLAQLRKAFEESRLRADAMEREGNSNFLQELTKSQRIKQRIDELNQQTKVKETNG
jgi:transcriptional regulator of heat shock response